MRERLDGRGSPARLQVLLTAVLAAAVFALLLGAVYVIGDLFDEHQQPVETFGSIEGRFMPTSTMIVDGREYAYYKNYFTNILVVGVDKEDIAAQATFRSGGQADFLMLLAIDRHHRTVTPIHIDRDTVTDVKVYSPFGHAAGINRMQICLSHAFGSSNKLNCDNTIWAVERLMHGIEVDHFLVLDMTGIAMLNDALGGVTVTLEDDFSHLDPTMTRGTTLTLQGKQAEYYVRGRHEVGDNSNRQRMSRQRTFLEGLAELFRSSLKENTQTVTELFETLADHMYTSLDSGWVSGQSYVIEHYEQKEIIDLEGEHRIGEDGYMEFHAGESELKRLIRDVYMNEESEVGIQ
ncbi:MAG: LCP family protein [Clostridia bacterium]|nr:LCP family protein [Clostridia bacterium]